VILNHLGQYFQNFLAVGGVGRRILVLPRYHHPPFWKVVPLFIGAFNGIEYKESALDWIISSIELRKQRGKHRLSPKKFLNIPKFSNYLIFSISETF